VVGFAVLEGAGQGARRFRSSRRGHESEPNQS
jgi:hypothetical protein